MTSADLVHAVMSHWQRQHPDRSFSTAVCESEGQMKLVIRAEAETGVITGMGVPLVNIPSVGHIGEILDLGIKAVREAESDDDL